MGTTAPARETHTAVGRIASCARILPAKTGDHPEICELLRAARQGISREDFQASLDAPGYEPNDRLLVKLDRRIVSHVQLTPEVMRFGPARLPVCAMKGLAIDPEYRTVDHCRDLLAAADRQMRARRCVLATLRTRSRRWFEGCGWVASGERSYSRANARDILAHIEARSGSERKGPRFGSRIWRHVELAALIDVYERSTACLFGPLERSEAYWHWLIGRQAHGAIAAAIDGRDTRDYGAHGPRIVGYAVVQRERIVELLTLPGHCEAAASLLAWVCREAIERGLPTVFLHTPAEDPLHDLLVAAGGTRYCLEGSCGGDLMLQLLDPPELVRRLRHVLRVRSRNAGQSCPCQLRLAVDGAMYRFTLTPSSARLVPDDEGPADLMCTRPQWLRLLLGGLDVTAACRDGRIRVANRHVLETVRALFPAFAIWSSTFDDLGAD